MMVDSSMGWPGWARVPAGGQAGSVGGVVQVHLAGEGWRWRRWVRQPKDGLPMGVGLAAEAFQGRLQGQRIHRLAAGPVDQDGVMGRYSGFAEDSQALGGFGLWHGAADGAQGGCLRRFGGEVEVAFQGLAGFGDGHQADQAFPAADGAMRHRHRVAG